MLAGGVSPAAAAAAAAHTPGVIGAQEVYRSLKLHYFIFLFTLTL
jgi:hypothetical protein